MGSNKSVLEYILNPLELLRTQKVLHVNPTIPVERPKTTRIHTMIYEYTAEKCNVYQPVKIEDAFSFLETDTKTWINVDGLIKPEIEKLAEHYAIHPLLVEDILSIGQRPKMDELNDQVFVVLNMLFFNEELRTIESEQVSIILGKNFVISFQEDESRDAFQPIRDKLKVAGSKLRQNDCDFLFYAMLDVIVDNYYIVLEKLGEHMEDLEEDIARQPDSRSLGKINSMRKELILFKRSVAPVREVIAGLMRSESELIDEKTEKYFKDVYDHIIQANDLTENYRDMTMSIQDLYLSNVNLKMNEVMKVMAVVTCLLAPATVIGGMFGMNFDKIPLLHNQWGFYISIGLMIIIPIIMLIAFRKRGWF